MSMHTDHQAPALDAEDAKLVTLARGARGRAAATEGAAVRDEDGRTYAVATAVASGARALEAAAVVGAATALDPSSSAAAADLNTPVIILAAADGSVRSRTQV